MFEYISNATCYIIVEPLKDGFKFKNDTEKTTISISFISFKFPTMQ